MRTPTLKRNALVVIALLLVGCSGTPSSQSLDRITELLPGKWAVVAEIYGTRLEGLESYSNDGTLESTTKITQADTTKTMRFKGTWAVEDETIVRTYTESNAPEVIPVGYVSKSKVTFIGESQFSYVDEEGTAVTLYRTK